MKKYDHFIDGCPTAPASGRYMESQSPTNRKPIGQVALGGADDVDKAVAAAQRALPGWRDQKPIERGRVLLDIARALRERSQALAELETTDSGKPPFQAAREVASAAGYFEFYGGLVNLPAGEVLDLGPGYHTYTRREPFGVVGVITPWNLPINQAARAAAPALAAGNTVVAKPSEFTPRTTTELANIAVSCGLPNGALNIILGVGPEAGAAIVRHPGVRKIAFTGSVRAGREIGAIAAERIIPVTLELGGKAANLVFEDADLDQAIPGSLRAFVTNAGQICSAGTRLLAHDSIVDKLVAGLREAAEQIEPGTHMGPLTTEAQYHRVCEYFAVAREEGLEVITGGAPIERPEGGYFVPPTIYRATNTRSRLFAEEVFGPVLIVLPFANEAEAVALANSSSYGLVSGLWTRDASRAHRVAAQLETGQVFINDWVLGGIETPFGGYKSSGIGREKGVEALRHYTQLKCVVMKIQPLQ